MFPNLHNNHKKDVYMTKLPFTKTVLMLSIAALLSACGGSSDDDSTGATPPTNPPPTGGGDHDPTASIWELGPDPSLAVDELKTFELSGVVGYNAPIAGATVCIDTTRDFTCDVNSPTAVTAEDGTYSMTVEAPYAVREFMVLASFPYAQINQDLNASAGYGSGQGVSQGAGATNYTGQSTAENPFVDGDQVLLAARAYYGGAVNPLTTLEAQQYDPSLNYLMQVERFAISRGRIAELYELSGNTRWAEVYEWSESQERDAGDWAERNARVLGGYAAATEYTENAFGALQLVSHTTDTGHFGHLAQWLGLANEAAQASSPFVPTSTQRAFAEQNMLTAEQQASVSLYPESVEINNDYIEQLSILYYSGGKLRFAERTYEDYYRGTPQKCWNPDEETWLTAADDFAGFPPAEHLGDGVYSTTNQASGAEVKLHLSALDPESSVYSAFLHGWNEVLDFSSAAVDGDLLRMYHEMSDELCVGPYGSPATQTGSLTSMSGDEIVAVLNPVLAQAGLYEVDEDLQRITVDLSGHTYDYRVIEHGEREVLVVFVVHGTAGDSFPVAYYRENGLTYRASYLPFERLNVGLRSVVNFGLTDQVATDLSTQMEAAAED